MCGIVCMISSDVSGFNSDEIKAFTDMLFADTLRGWDSTGVFFVDSNNNVTILKAAVSGVDFVRTKEYKDFINHAYTKGRIIVGHNRSATRGQVKDENAHPFWEEDNVILVQNGTWNGSHHYIKDTEVDTEVIAHLMHEYQNEIETGLQKIDAAYALIWYNIKKKVLYSIRNDERPLCIGYTNSDTVLIASETSTISFAAERAGLELQSNPYILIENALFCWEFNHANEIEFRTEKVDNKYKEIYNPSRHNFYPYQNNNIIPIKQIENSNVESIHITLNDYVMEGRFPDFENSYATAANLCKKYIEHIDKDKAVGVEFTDYLPCNTHKDCEAWYVFGNFISFPNKVLADTLVYALLFGKKEAAIIDYITNNIFTAKISFTSKRFVPKADKYVVTNFMDKLEKIEME